ncbi:MAG: efflux RND transporter periplasmic adaptor subunit [Thermoguttaceae bacterium]
MTTNPSPPASHAADDAWHEVDQLVEEIAQLAKSDISPDKFYANVLERIVSALGAEGGSVWTSGEDGEPCRQCQINPADPWLAGAEEPQPRHVAVISSVLKSGQSRLIVPHRQATPDDPAWNPTGLLLIVSPWTVDGMPLGAIEIFQRPDASPQSQQGYLRFVDAISDLIGDYCRNRLFRDLRLRAGDWTRLTQFAAQVHASLDLRATAYAIANDGRSLLECDRVTVLVRRGRRQYHVLAVSGVETFRRRASVVRRLEQLSAAVASVGETLWYPDAKDDLAPQVEQSLAEYLDESHSRWLAVLPLELPDQAKVSQTPPAIGILVAERFKGKLDQRRRLLLPAMCEHSALALRNALELEAIPLANLLRKAGRFFGAGRLAKIALPMAGVAAAGIALCLVPAELRIEARGELQPRQMADVFALTDGVVGDLRAEHGQHVAANQVLAELRRPQLDLEFKQVWGELQTARQRLASAEAEILQLHNETDEQRRRHSQLIAQQEELQELIRNLEEQHAILKKKQSELQVRSPMDGDVLTWDVQQLLQDRPVDRGQALLTVGNLGGPWKLDLRIPDRQIAHVLAAQREAGRALDVTYRLDTRPGVILHGTVEQIGLRSETAGSDEAYVPATVDIQRETVPELVPGANVKALICCGRRPVGYVWFHDLLDTLRTWFYW